MDFTLSYNNEWIIYSYLPQAPLQTYNGKNPYRFFTVINLMTST